MILTKHVADTACLTLTALSLHGAPTFVLFIEEIKEVQKVFNE